MDSDRRMDPRLYKAATQGNVEMLKQLVVAPEDRSVLGSTTPQLNTALHLAALHGHLDFAREVLYMKKELLVSQNGDGNNPLHLAAKAGKVEMAKLLVMHAVGWPLDQESPLIMANKAGNNPLHEAVWNHNAAVAVPLLDADPCRAYDLNKRMETPLHTAAREGLVYVVQAIVNYPWEPENPCVSVIGTPLHQATLGANLMIVEILLLKRPDLTDQTDSEGNNALHFAAQKDHERVVELLLNKRTKLAYNGNREGMSPLHVAVHYGSTNAIKVMLRHCPDVAEMVDGHGRNAFHAAVISGKANVLQCLLRIRHARPEELLNRTDTSGNTPLHLAAKTSRVDCALLLLHDRRVDICVRDHDGHTARSLVETKLHSGETDTYEMHLLKKLQQHECKRCRKQQLRPISSGGPRRGLSGKDFDSVVDAYFLAATLIATVTFAATFTMPGGYDQTKGTPLHGPSAAFKVFVLSNTVAMCISIVVIFLLIWARQEPVQLRLHNLIWSQRLTIIACLTLLVSLMTAVYITVEPIAPWLAYTVIAISTSTPALFFFISWLGR